MPSIHQRKLAERIAQKVLNAPNNQPKVMLVDMIEAELDHIKPVQLLLPHESFLTAANRIEHAWRQSGALTSHGKIKLSFELERTPAHKERAREDEWSVTATANFESVIGKDFHATVEELERRLLWQTEHRAPGPGAVDSWVLDDEIPF